MEEFDKLVKIVEKLRSRKGCRWDRAQKIKDLNTYLLEEVYELIDSLNSGKIDKIKEELGDVCFLLVFITQIFKEKKKFDIHKVLEKVNTKLITRHPHVFASKKMRNKREIVEHWIKLKAKEKERESVFDRLPKYAPSLLLGYILFKEIDYLGEKIDVDTIKDIVEKEIKNVNRSQNREEKLLKILWEVLKLASYYRIDLESSLRKKILKEAKKIKYPPKLSPTR